MVLIAGTCTAVCKKRWTATRLTHEVVQRFLEWDSLHYTPNHAKQDSLVIHRHDEKTTLRTSPTCRKYQNGLVTLVHQPNASSFNYFFGFPLGAHLPGQLSPSSMKALLSFPTALPPTWLMAGLCMSCWLGPQAESRYVSSLGVIDFFTLFKCPEMMILKEFDWRQVSARIFLQGQEKHCLRFMSDLSLHEFRFASMCESSDHLAFAQMFCWPNLNLWVRIANRFHERLQLVVRKVPSLHSSFHWPLGVLEAENR